MPDPAPSPPPWERGQGHDGPPERPQTYARFRGWLELGPSRSLAAYAAAIGIKRQTLYETARRFNWRQRAAAWDAAEAAAGRCPPPPPPPRPRAAPRHSSPPSPDPEAREADPTMAAAAEAAQASAPKDHAAALERYRVVMEALGRAMATEAAAALGLVGLLREDLAADIDRRRACAAAGDAAGAAAATARAVALVTMLARLSAVVTTMAAAGRQHWGDAVGVGQVLAEMARVTTAAGCRH